MSGMNVRVTAKKAEFVEREVANGDYASADDVVDDALSLLEAEREKVAALQSAIDVGIQEFERGEYSDLDMDEIMRSAMSRNPA